MDKIQSYLTEWTINYVKNKDILAKKIESIEKNKNDCDVFVKFKDKEQFFIVIPFIKDINAVIEKLDKEKHFSLVIFNTRENFKIIAENWKRLTDFRFLSIYFVNPFSKLDRKWIIYPYTHHRICDESSLETGLRSMFEMVEPITEEQLKIKLK